MKEKEILKQTTQNLFNTGDCDKFTRVLETYNKIPHLRIVAREIARLSKKDRRKGGSFITIISDSKIPIAREVAALCFGEVSKFINWREIAPFLKKLANDSEWDVREAAARGLKNALSYNFETVYPDLRKWAEDSRENIRRAVVLATMQKGLKDSPEKVNMILDLLEKLLPDRSIYVRKNLGPFALGYLGYTYPVILLPRLSLWSNLENEQARWNVAMAFSQALGRRYPEEALEILTTLAHDERRFVWRAAVSSLVNIDRAHPGLVISKVEEWIKDDTLKKVVEVFSKNLTKYKIK